MLLWKILACIDVLINLGYWHAVLSGRERLKGFDFLAVPIGLVGTLALITYAFSQPALPETFWRLFLPFFIAAAAWEIMKAANRPDLDVGRLLGVGMVLILVGFTSVAIYRLGGTHWAGL